MLFEATKKHWRYTEGDLIKITQSHVIWKNDLDFSFREHFDLTSRVEKDDVVIFLQAYGYKIETNNWKRPEWNLLVVSAKLGLIWVTDEYTTFVD